MRRAPLLLGFVGIAIAAAIIGGLMVVGSPEEARRERMDKLRARDLSDIAAEISVHVGAGDRALPDGLEDVPPISWGMARRTDPETGRPYEYTRLDAQNFELCATFTSARSEEVGRTALNAGPFATRVKIDIRGPGRGCVTYMANPDIVRIPAPAPPSPARP